MNNDNEDYEEALNIIFPFLDLKKALFLDEIARKFSYFVSYNDLSRFITITLEKHYNIDDKTKSKLLDEFKKIHNNTVKETSLPIKAKFNIPDKRAIEYSSKLTDFYFGKYFKNDQDNRKNLLNWLNKHYLENGNPITKDKPDEFIKEFGKFLDHNSSYKARQIIDTSVSHIKNSAKLKQMNGVVKSYRWSAIGDRLSCNICRSMDGRIFSVENAYNILEKIENSNPSDIEKYKPFINKPQLQKSSDIVDTYPPAHPNCRCQIIAHFDDRDITAEVVRPDIVKDNPHQEELEKEFNNLTEQERINKIKAHLSASWFAKGKGGKFDHNMKHAIRHFKNHHEELDGVDKLEEYTKRSYNVIKNYDKVYVQREYNNKVSDNTSNNISTKYIFEKDREIVVSTDKNLVITSYHKLKDKYISYEDRFDKDGRNGNAGLISLL